MIELPPEKKFELSFISLDMDSKRRRKPLSIMVDGTQPLFVVNVDDTAQRVIDQLLVAEDIGRTGGNLVVLDGENDIMYLIEVANIRKVTSEMTKFWSPDGKTYYNVAHIVIIKLRHDLRGGRHLQITLSDSRVQEIDLLDDDVVAEVLQEIITGTVSASG